MAPAHINHVCQRGLFRAATALQARVLASGCGVCCSFWQQLRTLNPEQTHCLKTCVRHKCPKMHSPSGVQHLYLQLQRQLFACRDVAVC